MHYYSGRIFAHLRRMIGTREFLTVADALAAGGSQSHHTLFRVDVERRLGKCFRLAKQLAAMGIPATFYVHTRTSTYRPRVLRTIADLGHEVGYHYECLDRFGGDFPKARALFLREVKMFRDDGIRLRTATGHGELGIRFNGYRLASDLLDRYPDLLAEAELLGGPHDWIRRADAVSATDKFSQLKSFWSRLETDQPLHILVHWHRWSAVPPDSAWEVARDLAQFAKNRLLGKRRYRVARHHDSQPTTNGPSRM
jgi:hypothetical protein